MMCKIFSFFILMLLSPFAFSNTNFFNDSNVIHEEHFFSLPINILLIITFLSFLASLIFATTSFTRIIIVFSLLRNALGTPYAPPNQILLGLSLILTFFIMQPTFNDMYEKAYLPFSEKKINIITAFSEASKPLKIFMLKQIHPSNLQFFYNLSKKNFHYKKSFSNVPMYIVMPAFILSELQTAFKIGFIILMPFLMIDLIVSSILMSLGMMMVPPSTISLPIKLMFFVLVNGWQLLIGSLANSFH